MRLATTGDGPKELRITAIHYEKTANGVAVVMVTLPNGRKLEAIRDGHSLASHTAYVSGSDDWPVKDQDEA